MGKLENNIDGHNAAYHAALDSGVSERTAERIAEAICPFYPGVKPLTLAEARDPANGSPRAATAAWYAARQDNPEVFGKNPMIDNDSP